MSTDQQTYSIENQRDAIRSYTDLMGYDIVATYEDPGRSGLSIEGRPGLRRLLRDVESGRADFETVVVYDVSRWGRFQNIDESASYEYRCQMAGVRIEFCAEQFVNDGSLGSDVMKAIKRSMAAELSRMLSQRVFVGQSRIVKMGFRGGGHAGFGLRRLLVDAAGNPKATLKIGEQKSLVTDRVVLVPGPAEEIGIVQWIFKQYLKGKTEVEIASVLNGRGIATDLGQAWTKASVRTILTNEKYVGDNVWNRISTRLQRRRVRNPASAWVRAESVFEPLVSRAMFNRVQAFRRARARRITNEQMLVEAANVLKERGALSGSILTDAPNCRSASHYMHRFGTLQAVYKLIGYDASSNYRDFDINSRLHQLRLEIIQDLLAAIGDAGGLTHYDRKTQLVRVNEEFTVAISIARCRLSAQGYLRWPFRKRRLARPNISILIRMEPDHAKVRDFLIAPAWEAERAPPMLLSSNGVRLDGFLFQSLDPLVELARRAPIGGGG